MDTKALIDIIKDSGIVGAGGAGFPTYAKLSEKADTIILNCAECEPLLKLHRQLLENNAYEILYALNIIADTLGVSDVIIALKESYKEATEAVKVYLDSFKKTKICFLPEIYPAGDEVVLVYETTKRVVPPGDIPISVGAIVFNVETIYNVYNSIENSLPVTHKFVTVAGEVNNPVTLNVPLGISFKELIELAGGTTISDYALIKGGPMTGAVASLSEPVTKTTNAVLVVPQNHYIIKKRQSKISIDMKRAMAACCQCRMCTDLCPRNLLGHPIKPHEFMRVATSGDTKDIRPYIETMYCSACGVCEMYACTQELSPRTLITEYKMGLRKNGVAIPKVESSPVSKTRDYKKVSISRLVARLGLAKYDVPAPIVEEVYSPNKVRLALSQSVGAPARAVVKKGDKVKTGDLIAKPDAKKLGVGLHASIDGVVMDVNDKFITIKK